MGDERRLWECGKPDRVFHHFHGRSEGGVLHILRVMNLCIIFCINGRVRIQTGLLLMVHGSYPQMAILWNMMQRQSVTVQQVL